MKLRDLFKRRRETRWRLIETNKALCTENRRLCRELENFKKYHYSLFELTIRQEPAQGERLVASLAITTRTIKLAKEPEKLVFDIAKQLWYTIANSQL